MKHPNSRFHEILNIRDLLACRSLRVSLLSGSFGFFSFSFSDGEKSSAVSKLSPELICDILPNRRSLMKETAS